MKNCRSRARVALDLLRALPRALRPFISPSLTRPILPRLARAVPG